MTSWHVRILSFYSLTLCFLLSSASAVAQSVRTVLLTKTTIEGKTRSQSDLDTIVASAYRENGLRVVDLSAALAAQRFAFSDSVQAGKLPDALSVLNADTVCSLQLDCSLSSGAVMGSSIKAYYCAINTKVIRVDLGDVIYSKSDGFTAHGLNAEMALQNALTKRIRPKLTAQAKRWVKSFTRSEQWKVDLVVTRIADRARSRALVRRLRELPGVNGARLVVFNRDIAKYTLEGSGKNALEFLADALESRDELALKVTYQTPRLLHAEFDFAKAYRREVMVMGVLHDTYGDRSLGAQIVDAAIANLPYLRIAHSHPLIAFAKNQKTTLRRLRVIAMKLDVPLVLTFNFIKERDVWSTGIELVEIDKRITIAAASGQGANATDAMDQAIRRFDSAYRQSLAEPEKRHALGFVDQTPFDTASSALVINAFNLPELVSDTKQMPPGRIEITNTSAEPVTQASLTVSAATRRLFASEIQDLAPGASQIIPVSLNGVEKITARMVRLTAVITYQSGSIFEKVSSVAPLILNKTARRIDTRQASVPGRYYELIEVAVEHYNRGEWVKARAVFQKSHALYPCARTFRALGMVEFDLRNYSVAADYLRKALTSHTKPLNNELRQEVKNILSRAEKQLKRNVHEGA